MPLFGATEDEHLSRKLGVRSTITEESRAQRERWIQKLDRLRNRGATGKPGVPLQEILDDIRLGVSEVVTDIVANTTTRWLCLNLSVDPGSVRIEALGTEDVVPVELLSPLLSRNFTPQVMDSVTDRWGLRRDGSSTLWFEKDVATSPEPPAESVDPGPATDRYGTPRRHRRPFPPRRPGLRQAG
jgi:hypothetical protein